MVYEYAMLEWEQTTNWYAEVRTATIGSKPQQTWDYALWLDLPGVERVKLEHTSWFVALNDLGRDGWRLVQSGITKAVVGGAVNGFYEASRPISYQLIFEREVPA